MTRNIGEEIDDCIPLASRIAEREKILTSFGRRRINPPFKLNFFREELDMIKKILPGQGGWWTSMIVFFFSMKELFPAKITQFPKCCTFPKHYNSYTPEKTNLSITNKT